MAGKAILYPVLVQVFLTFAVLILLGPARQRSMRERGQTLDDPDLALGRAPWSEQATKVANNFQNQFELPVLFYLAAVLAFVTRTADVILIGLAWLFVATRCAHSAIHIGPNVIRWRGAAYLIGFAVLVVMWLLLAWRIVTATGV